jgi:hypothetical protein
MKEESQRQAEAAGSLKAALDRAQAERAKVGE